MTAEEHAERMRKALAVVDALESAETERDRLAERCLALEAALRGYMERYDGHLPECPEDGICEATCQDFRALLAAEEPA